MSPPAGTPTTGLSEPTLADEITRSLTTIWNRHSNSRPTKVSTEIDGDVVRCTLTDAVASFAAGPAAPEEGEAPKATAPIPTYQHEATGAIARLTKRKVLAFIPRHNKKTDVATETFILEEKRRRN